MYYTNKKNIKLNTRLVLTNKKKTIKKKNDLNFSKYSSKNKLDYNDSYSSNTTKVYRKSMDGLIFNKEIDFKTKYLKLLAENKKLKEKLSNSKNLKLFKSKKDNNRNKSKTTGNKVEANQEAYFTSYFNKINDSEKKFIPKNFNNLKKKKLFNNQYINKKITKKNDNSKSIISKQQSIENKLEEVTKLFKNSFKYKKI